MKSAIGLKAAFAGIREGRDGGATTDDDGIERGRLAEDLPRRLGIAIRGSVSGRAGSLDRTAGDRAAAQPGDVGAKSTHPDFAPVKVYLRKATRKQAMRRWEDSTGGDLSELVEHLLQQYLST